jgi:hypothetical protein
MEESHPGVFCPDFKRGNVKYVPIWRRICYSGYILGISRERGESMGWPVNAKNVRLLGVYSDGTEGELVITAVLDEAVEQDIVYEGVFYQQFAGSSAGLVIDSVTELPPEGLANPKHAASVARLCDDCGADEQFIRAMYRRGSRLYAHHTDDGGEYLVLAKRVCLGESRPYSGCRDKYRITPARA